MCQLFQLSDEIICSGSVHVVIAVSRGTLCSSWLRRCATSWKVGLGGGRFPTGSLEYFIALWHEKPEKQSEAVVGLRPSDFATVLIVFLVVLC